MLDSELTDIVANLRTLGADIAAVEVKRAQDGLPKSLRATLSSFANTSGGVIILGLEEDSGFAVTGVSEPARLAADLGAMCSDDMEPPVRPLINIHRFEGHHVLVAEVPELPRDERPCHYRGAGLVKGSYVRIGDSDRRMTTYEVQVVLSSRSQPREDEQPVPGVGPGHLNAAEVEAFVARLRSNRPYAFGDLPHDAVLRRAKVLVPGDGEDDVVSLGGLLALGRYPQEHFPQLMVTFVHYPSNDGPASEDRFLDNVMLEGPIPVMVRDTLAAIRRNMSRRAHISGAGRQDVWEYPETALREAVVNALVHRDLSNSARGTQVQVEMYPDRLVIRSPGGLFGPVTVDSLGDEGLSSARNASLMKILEDVSFPAETRTVCENRGSGIRAMVDALISAGMNPPTFDDKISSFVVVFPNHTWLREETVKWIETLGEQGLTDSQCLALVRLYQGEVIDNRSYRTMTGVDSRVATSELRDLVARELIIQIGTRRWARYELASRGAARGRADRRQELLAALGEATLSRAELAERSGLSDPTVSRWLKVMRNEGRVRLVGSPKSRNARYRRVEQSSLFSPQESE